MREYVLLWDPHVCSYEIPTCSYEIPFSYLTIHLCCGKTRCALWQDKISVVARQDLSCCFAPRPFVDSLMSWHKREILSCHNSDLALPRKRSCLATTEILSCHSRDLVVPQQRSCLGTTETLSCHNTHLVLPHQRSSN